MQKKLVIILLYAKCLKMLAKIKIYKWKKLKKLYAFEGKRGRDQI